MKRISRFVVILVGLSIFMTVVFGAGVVAGTFVPLGRAASAPEPPEFTVFWQAWDLVQKNFVDRSALDPTALTRGAIRGMVQSLGDEGHTTYLTKEDLAAAQSDLAGKFFGIGAQLGTKNGLPIIATPFDGSPAAAAGLRSGDVILKVDGEDVTSLPLNELANKVRGPAGTPVELTIHRSDESQDRTFVITRGEINVPAATWAPVPGTSLFLIRLSRFSEKAEHDIVTAIKASQAAGAKGLILDVRNNPGGLLAQAVKVTSQFIADGNALQEEDADGTRTPYAVEPGGIATTIPLVVLINQGTASSAEILAGAIQDHRRGTLVGETTIGTGTVLRTYVLSDGSALLLGTSQWLTANGRLIRKHGIDPDSTVVLAADATMVSPSDLKEMSLSDLLASSDAQLLKALDLLNEYPLAPRHAYDYLPAL